MFKRIFHRIDPEITYAFSFVLLASALSLIASLVLSVESVTLAANPGVKLHCDVSALISCGTVGSHWTASLLGFPNAFIGLVAMPVFITLAVEMLSGAKIPKWIMIGGWWGVSASLIFAGWMFYTSYFVIGALCPWCLVVSFSSVILWFAWFRFMIVEKHCLLPKKAKRWLYEFAKKDYDKLAMWAVIVAMAVAIIAKYF
ncbi:MAG: vitamin K epoxide reductase [Acidobacteria bacterium]|nr:MAG: vitamin K epoxide reductase [Acidobacteriota bacterium]